MKYLKFYEAFKSKGISNTIKFLKDKVGNQTAQVFLYSLRDFMDNLDFPINEISDDNIKYMSAKKALALKSDKQVTNQKGIWALKYWFSLKEGYLGYSSTGNETYQYNRNSTNSQHGLREQRKFTDENLDYIKDNVVRIGEIWPVNDYNKLKTGDIVIGCFDGSFNYDKLAMAKIFVDNQDNRRTYAVQSVSDGSIPRSNDWRNYRQYGSLTWWLFDDSELGNDHTRLHFYRPSTEDIHYIEEPSEDEQKEQEEIEEDPLIWNLPLSNRYSVSRWGRGSSISYDNIKKADFALVLYFDDLINPDSDATNYERPSDTRQQRRSEKQGATKLMTDDEIKKINIERYIQKLSATLNITETEFSDLQKIVTKHLAQEFSYFSILFQSPNWSNITEFTDYFYQMIDGDEGEKSYYLNRAKNLYTTRVREYYNRLLKYQESKKWIKGDSDLKKIFDELYKCGQNIFQHFSNMKIETIDDLWLVKQKINNLYAFMRMSRNQFSYAVREVLSGFRYADEMEYYFNSQKNNYDKYKEDLEIIKRIDSFLKTL